MKLGLFVNILGEGIASELPTSYPHLTYLLCALLCIRPPSHLLYLLHFVATLSLVAPNLW